MSQLWHTIVDTIRQLPSEETRLTLSQKPTMDDAVDKLTHLITLRRGGVGNEKGLSVEPPSLIISGPPTQRAGTPSSTTLGGGGGGGVSTPGSIGGGNHKRKRKTSFSTSPVPPSHHGESLSAGTGGGGGGRGSTPMSREATGKQRREMYYDQLPLQPGRKVAFKLPANKTKADGGGAGDDTTTTMITSTSSGAGGGVGGGIGGSASGDDWILATVKRCIQQDRMRYEVQDVDDGNAYNTTLRSIIPLPDPTSPTHLSSHPSNLEDFPRDSQVLALYPDTTSFYRATVVSAPIPGTGNGLGVRGGNGRAEPGAKKGLYRLAFVDDDGNVLEVQKDYVVAFPS
ncbi:hypothetical protein CI109_103186 [Kwoniella shandongensis]|uniref:Uncharacterized protein n=1 Tax=Kwoniella shandongensis TaxID=1734106 RepID=A0A5M6CDK6_9TREE|nr:uncharacterized protein CI109_000377 [Kwoniella shandongensis]KAA5531535.1 hypothetical protein CI109_000377 [Kwoniella shandongensis]